MTIRPHIVLFVAVMLLVSCAHEEMQKISNLMSFRLASRDSMLTRAADGINDNSTFIFPADFTVAVEGENYFYTASTANTNMTSPNPASFPINGNSVRIQAFYPSFKIQYATTPQTFTVAQNQSQTGIGTANYRVSDLMYGIPATNGTAISWGTGTWNGLDGSGKVYPTEDPIPLVFEHKMAKIRIDVTTNGATVKRIVMKNVQRSIDFNTMDATFSGLATADDGLGDNVIMYDDATGTSINFTCTALIPKQDLATSTPFIDVVVDAQPSDITMTYKLHEAASFDCGKKYIYNMSVSMDELEVSCSIVDWTSASGEPEFTQSKTL